MTDLQRRMKELADQLRMHRRRYYVLDQPTVSDAEYDALERELRTLEAAHPELADPNSPTQRVGAPPVDAFEKRRHTVPMLSLDNAYSEEELRAWEAKLLRLVPGSELKYAAELKVDGLSLSLRYETGKLVEALTRGDGEIGELVTENARTIADIPVALPADAPQVLLVRGEVFLSRKRWEELNRQRDARGEPRFANPRNAASGTMKLLDSREVAARGLSFLPWQALGDDAWPAPPGGDQAAAMAQLEAWGFSRMPAQASGGMQDMLRFISAQASARLKLPFDTDGVVLKILDFSLQKQLGATDRVPRWAIAFKYPAAQVTTQVLGITWQVGRSGKLTPVAELEAVEVAGSTVRRATLHNADELARLGLKVGHRVFIEKGGEVIPKVVALVPGEESRELPAVVIPATCPECSGEVGKTEDGEVAIRCLNPECPAKLAARLLHLGGRSALDIEGLGEALVEQLVASGRFDQPWDVFSLLRDPREGLAYINSLDGFAELSARNLIDALQQALTKPLWRWIHALGIPNVGESTSRILACAFPSFELLWEMDEYTPLAIETIGSEVGKALKTFANQHPSLPAELAAYGVAPTSAEPERFHTVALDTWLSFIGIAELGPVTARNLLQALGGFPELWASNEEEILRSIEGKKILKSNQKHIPMSLAEFSKVHPRIPQQLELLGVTKKKEKSVTSDKPRLSGLTCVVTGTLSSLTREEAEARLRKLGAKVVGSVSRATSFLVAGDKAGSNKLSSAQTFGIPIKDEAWLLALFDEER